jgi:hypothetical protein
MQSFLFLNGCILFAIGGGLGIPYWIVLARSPNAANAWRVAHSSITVGGIGVTAISSAYHMIQLPEQLHVILVAGVLVTGYGFGISTVLGALTGHRGLEWKPGVPAVVVILMVLGTIGSAVAGCLMVYGAYRNWAGLAS